MTEASRRSIGRDRFELLGWATAAFVLAALAVPWFLWRDSTVVAGLPLWLWWHIGWMGLASLVFYAFTRYGWGVGILRSEATQGSSEEERESDGVLRSEATQGSSDEGSESDGAEVSTDG